MKLPSSTIRNLEIFNNQVCLDNIFALFIHIYIYIYMYIYIYKIIQSMDNLPEVECSIQGCRLVELDIVIYLKLSKTSSHYTVFHA